MRLYTGKLISKGIPCKVLTLNYQGAGYTIVSGSICESVTTAGAGAGGNSNNTVTSTKSITVSPSPNTNNQDNADNGEGSGSSGKRLASLFELDLLEMTLLHLPTLSVLLTGTMVIYCSIFL